MCENKNSCVYKFYHIYDGSIFCASLNIVYSDKTSILES